MHRALVRAAIAAFTATIVAGPFAAAGSAAQLCAGIVDYGDWEKVSAPTLPQGGSTISAYAIDPLAPDTIFVTNGTMVMESNDGGCSWKPGFTLELLPNLDDRISSANTTIEQIVVPESPEPGGEQTVFLTLEETVGPAVRPHVAVSHNGGNEFSLADNGLPLVSGGGLSLAVSPASADIAYLLMRENPTGIADTVYATHNAGGTWEQQSAASGTAASDLLVDPLDPQELWLWGASGLMHSTNGGWDRKAIPFITPPVTMVDVFRAPGSPSRILAYEPETQTFAFSTDGGNTWAREPGPRIFSHSIAHGRTAADVVVSGHDGVYQMVEPGIWLPIARKDQPDLYDLQASRAGQTVVYGFAPEANTLERYTALDFELQLDPFKDNDVEVEGVADEVTRLSPRTKTVKLDAGGAKKVRYRLGLPPHPTPLDVFFLVDTSNSMESSINGLRSGMEEIINDLERAKIDVQFGVAEYKDYPIPGYGDPDAGDFPYRLDRKIGPADAGLADALEKLQASGGGAFDLPESQLTGLYQAATGAGDPGFVPPGQDAGFRPGALKVIVHLTDAQFHTEATHPSPPWDQVAEALHSKGILQIGLAVFGRNGPKGLPHLTDMAEDTDTHAPSSVDCNGDGDADVQPGQPLACIVGGELEDGSLDLAPTIIASLKAVTEEVDVRLAVDNSTVTGGIAPTEYPVYDVVDADNLTFDVTFTCPRTLAGEKQSVRLAALVAGRAVAHADARVICRPVSFKREPEEILPLLIAGVLPRFVVPGPPAPPPPIVESAPGTQQMFQAQPAAAAQEQEEVQTAVAWQEALQRELAEEYSFSSRTRTEPASPWPLYAAGLLMAGVYAAASIVRLRPSLRLARTRR